MMVHLGGRWRRLAAGIIVLVLGLAACGGDGGDSGEADITDGEAVEDGGMDDDESSDASATLIAVAPAVLSTVDPERYEGNISLDLLPNLAGTLLWWDEPADGADVLQTPDEVVPALAEAYEVLDDGTRIRFTLRDDAASPYGNMVTSEDVEWSFERMINSEGIPIARILLNQAGWDLENPIDIVDERTFDANIANPNAVSLSVLTTYFTQIFDTSEISQHITDDDPYAYNWLAINDASFGAYTVASIEPGEEIRLETNPGYYGEIDQYTDVIVRSVPDGSTRLQLLQRGEVGVAYGLAYDQLAAVEGDDNVRLSKGLFPSVLLLVMNHEVEPFGDQRVREAIAYAVDRDAIVSAAYNDFAVPGNDFYHDAFGFEEPDTAVSRDLDRSRALLTEAGVESLTIEVAYNIGNLGPEVEQLVVLLRDQLAEVGIEVEPNNVASSADFDAGKRDGSLEAWIATSAPQIPDPAYYTQTFYGSEGIVNLSGYASPELDALAIEILQTDSGPERENLVRSANELKLADMPMVPLVDPDKYYAFASDVENFVPYAQDSVTFSRLRPAD